MLDGAPLPRAEIAWVGLATGDSPPPAGATAGQDALHLVDGTVVSTPVLGISLGAVATETESYERERVRWVRFAGELTVPLTDVLVLAAGLVESERRAQALSELFHKDLERWTGLNDMYRRCLIWAEQGARSRHRVHAAAGATLDAPVRRRHARSGRAGGRGPWRSVTIWQFGAPSCVEDGSLDIVRLIGLTRKPQQAKAC